MTLVDCPESSRGEWRFRLFDIPVRVHPWFWFTTIFMSATRDAGGVLIWVAVCFVSILLHELGHVLAFRVFGEEAEALLYSWGGLAIPKRGVRMGTFAETVIGLAGPMAGFGFGLLVAGCALMAGAKFHLTFHTMVIPSLSATIAPSFADASNYMRNYYLNLLLDDLLFVNIYWGLVNLLPIYPLDGGRVSRALFASYDPVRGYRRFLILSIATATSIAVLGLLTRSIYMVAMFGILAAASAQMLESDRPLFRARQS